MHFLSIKKYKPIDISPEKKKMNIYYYFYILMINN